MKKYRILKDWEVREDCRCDCGKCIGTLHSDGRIKWGYNGDSPSKHCETPYVTTMTYGELMAHRCGPAKPGSIKTCFPYRGNTTDPIEWLPLGEQDGWISVPLPPRAAFDRALHALGGGQ